MDNVKTLAFYSDGDLYETNSFLPYSELFNENLSLYSKIFDINLLLPESSSEFFSKPSDLFSKLFSEPLFEPLSEPPSELLSELPSKPPSGLPSKLPSGPLSEPLSGSLSEPPSELPSEPLIEPLSEPLSKPLNESLFELTLDEDIDPLEQSNNYQYNLTVGDSFDNWSSVDTFMYQYCLEHGFGYQIF
jgi:hypothetical protein